MAQNYENYSCWGKALRRSSDKNLRGRASCFFAKV